MINNRQNGRRRGRGGGQQQRPGGGGGGQGQRDSGNRIDSRARGNAAQLLEKYKNMARDAQMSGDRVNTEYYLQFADHYFRVLADQRGRTDEQQPVRRQRDDFDQFDDIDDFGDEGEPIRADEQSRVSEAEAPRRERFRDERPRDDRGRDDRPRESREERPRDDRQRDDRPRDDRQRDERPREDRVRAERFRDDRPREDRPRTMRPEATEERQASVNTVTNDAAEAGPVQAGDEDAPRRRRVRKPREDNVTVASDSPSLDADRLPPALGVSVSAGEGEEAPKPRRRRVRTAVESAPAE